MASNPTLQRHYLRLIRLWPSEALRSVNVQDSLRRRMVQRLVPAPQRQHADATVAPPPPPTQANWIDAKADAATAEQTTANLGPALITEETEMKQLNALYSLLENRYSRTYPTSERLLRPESKPSYYEELAAEMEAAPKRSWWQKKIMRLTSLVRFT